MKKQKLANSYQRKGINSKAFTLVELLAVVIIIALLAVLIIPKVTETINNSKESINKSSAAGLERVANQYYAEQKLKGTFDGCIYNFTTNTNTCSGLEFTGEKPTKGKLNISKDGKVDYAVEINNTCYIKKYKSNNIITKSYNEETCDYNTDFSKDSWSDIKENLTEDREYYPIGSEKTITMDIDGDETEETYTLRLVNRESCPSTWVGSETACGVVLEFKEVIAEHEYNGTSSSYTNEGGWPATNTTNPLYTYVNDTLYNKLPSELKSIIINTKAISGYGYFDTSNFESTDKLYLLTSGELGAKHTNDTIELAASNDNVGTGKTKTLEYYANSSNLRIKDYDETVDWYWLRSAGSNTSNAFLAINADDDYIYYSAAYNSGGVAPAFRILP